MTAPTPLPLTVNRQPTGGSQVGARRTDVSTDGPSSSLRRLGWVLFGVQLVAMVVFSIVEYQRFALTKDFGINAQGLWLISHGHLDPYSTVAGAQLWQNNAEFILWPISLVYRLFPHAWFILILQDGVVVLTELVVFAWILDVLIAERHRLSDRAIRGLALGSLGALLVNPWAYETIAFDFHTHVFAALFAVFAGRDLWRGRSARLWVWVPLAFVSNAPGGLYIAGLGLTGIIAGRRTRANGVALALAGAAYFLLITSLGGDGVGGHGLSAWYGYLVGPHRGRVGIFDVLLGALRHPNLVAHMVRARWMTIFEFVLPMGLIGTVSPWGFGVALVVFAPSALTASTNFLRFDQSFQSWPALPFVLLGTVLLLIRVKQRGRVGERAFAASTTVWAVCAIVLALALLPGLPRYWISVDTKGASVLSSIERQVPAQAEVAASNGVVGRFSERPFVYVLGYSSQTGQFAVTTSVPVRAKTVVFVVAPNQGVEGGLDQLYRRTVQILRHRIHAKEIASSNGIYVFVWHPPAGVRSVVIS